MSKVCEPLGGATGSIYGKACLYQGFGRCTGRYGLVFAYDPIFIVSTGSFYTPDNIIIERYFYSTNTQDTQIWGSIFCVTEPEPYYYGGWTCIVGSTTIPRFSYDAYNRVLIPDQTYPPGVPKFIGLRYLDGVCPSDSNCSCTNGDETITCSNAEGGICCIPKSLLDGLCAKV
jgi:hypothetical protein